MPIPAQTPAKKPFALPSDQLSTHIGREWEKHEKFTPARMPMTALSFTAIDRIEPQKDAVIEALLVYADTDTLCYRAPDTGLAARQKEKWDIVLGWSSLMLGTKWATAEGIMPLEQPEKLHAALRAYLAKKDAFALAAFSVLAGGFSSLVLAKAVAEKHLSVEEAFALSRLEEDYATEKWGVDEEAESKAQRLRAEMIEVGEFLKLLES